MMNLINIIGYCALSLLFLAMIFVDEPAKISSKSNRHKRCKDNYDDWFEYHNYHDSNFDSDDSD